jgi:GDP-L-fucose synthase
MHALNYANPGDRMTGFMNIGTGEDQTIAEIAGLVRSVVGFAGNIGWDHTKPDGTYKKLLDVSMQKRLDWRPSYSLTEGIRSVYAQYRSS